MVRYIEAMCDRLKQGETKFIYIYFLIIALLGILTTSVFWGK